LDEGSSVTSSKSGETFPIGTHVDCHSVDVIYVITCTKCGKQGVGECVRPIPRMQQYIRRITERISTSDADSPLTGDVKIVQHFLATPHHIEDMRMMLIDKVPGMHGMWDAIRSPVRRRWELVWMDRLQTELNKIRDWRHSFPGAFDNRGRGKGKGKGRGIGKGGGHSQPSA